MFESVGHELIANHSQRRFRDRKDTYTKQLEKKIGELEGMSASLQLELAQLSEKAEDFDDSGAREPRPKCPRCGLGDHANEDRSPRTKEGGFTG